MYFYGWKRGLKTGQYYLRTRRVVSAKKITVTAPTQTSTSTPVITQTSSTSIPTPTPSEQQRSARGRRRQQENETSQQERGIIGSVYAAHAQAGTQDPNQVIASLNAFDDQVDEIISPEFITNENMILSLQKINNLLPRNSTNIELALVKINSQIYDIR
jgi:hypothetical protein